jgi:hypothetical protein
VKTYRERALEIALGEVGIHEIGFHNRGRRVDQYERADDLPGVGYSWCMSFVQWCYRQAGHRLPTLSPSVGIVLNWARMAGLVTTGPRRGDLVCFNFDADSWPDHVGFVIHNYPLYIRTVEGNTSPGTGGSQADGGGVYRRTRRKSRCIFIRVPGRPRRPHHRPVRRAVVRRGGSSGRPG